MKAIITAILIILLLIGCRNNSEQQSDTYFQRTGVSFTTGNEALQELFDSAETKVEKNIIQYNDEYRVMVEGAVYPFVFLETQPMAGGMYAKRDLEIGYNNIAVFLKNQREDGRLAGLIVNMDNDIWGMRDNMTIVDEGTLGLFFGTLQGLYLSEAAFELSFFLDNNRDEFLELVKTGLKKYDEYLWKTRDSDGDGCLEIWAMTDAGEDHMKRLNYAPWTWPYDYPPTSENIPMDDTAFIKERWIITGWETLTLDKVPVPMESLDIMGYSYSCRNILYEIAKQQGDKDAAVFWRGKADEVKRKMKDYLWIDDRHSYFYRNPDNEFINSLTHNNLRAMYYGAMTQDMANRFIKHHLLNPKEFWTYMPIPSVAVNDPYFENRSYNNWGGQSQNLTYQRAIRALENYGHHAEVCLFGHKLMGRISESKLFTQQFDPFTGEQSGIDGYDYGPSILAVLECFSRMYGIDVCKDTVHFNGLPLEEEYEYIQVIGDNTYTLRQKNGILTGIVNGELKFTCSAGVKVKTGLDGSIFELVGIDSVSRSVYLTCDSKSYNFTVSPNTVFGFQDEAIVIREVPFDYPFKIALDSTTPGLTDPRDGNTYRIVKIGEQVWMAENLRFLPGVAGPGTGSKTTPYFYVYGYDGINVDDAKATAKYNIYGVLYNWPAAMNEATSSDANPSGVQGVCPSGWHLPSDAEWTQLTDYLGTRVAGGKLKASGTTLWDPPNSGANNETGFSAFPGGYRNADGTFVSMGEDADFWSASEYNSSHAWFRNIHFNDNDVGRNKYPRQTGFAVRCVKD